MNEPDGASGHASEKVVFHAPRAASLLAGMDLSAMISG